MQNRYQSDWKERSIFYNCRMFLDGFWQGMEYGELESCIHVGILDFNLQEEFAERVVRVQIPPMYRHLVPAKLHKKVVVGEGECGLLYVDNHFVEQLERGTYYY